MKLSAIAKFDSSVFDTAELDDLQRFVAQCEKATTAAAIEKTGTELDERKAQYRAESREQATRSRSLNALFKYCIREVPRRLGTAIVPESEGEVVA